LRTKPMLMNRRSQKKKRAARESGQAAVFLVLAMGIFLIGSMGFVVDGANLWFHRQSAQTAADAACTSGAMDMLSVAAGANPPSPNWIGTSSFQCSGTDGGGGNVPNSGFVPCQYAALNGYTSSGLQSSEPGTDVSVSFPATFASMPSCSGTSTLCTAEDVAATPYMQVNVTDRVQTTFIGMLSGGHTVDVGAQAMCGLSNVLSVVPVLVLNPNAPNSGATSTMAADSGSSLTVFSESVSSGSQKAIQVNSSDPSAIDFSSATVDLSHFNGGIGGNFAVVTRESLADANVTLANAKSHWVNAAGLTSDPFATIDPPSKPGDAPPIGHSCPDYDSHVHCDDYQGGYYPAAVACNGTTVSICIGTGHDTLAVFEPGIYYLDGDFATSNSGHKVCMRPGTGIGDGSGGTMFYLHGSSTLNKSSSPGQLVVTVSPGNVTVFSCADPAFGLPVSSLSCNSNIPPGVTTLTGNVLLAPCTGPYGDPLGARHERGILFFHDRDTQPTAQPSWRAASSFGLIGSLYFHNCSSTTAAGSGVNCDPSAFTETLTLSSGANGYVIGNIVADQLHLGGSITVGLSPKKEYYTLKASLLQ
jgi:hypothetical protein